MKKFFAVSICLMGLRAFGAEVYQQSCRVIGEDDYVKYSLEIENGFRVNSKFTLKMTAYEDENCQTPYLQYNQYFHISDIQNEALNLKTEKITYTTATDETTDALNMIQYCDHYDWAVKTEMDVTGKVCEDFQQLALGQVLFQSLKQSGDQIQLGIIDSKQNGRSEQARPTGYDLEFTKVVTAPSLLP